MSAGLPAGGTPSGSAWWGQVPVYANGVFVGYGTLTAGASGWQTYVNGQWIRSSGNCSVGWNQLSYSGGIVNVTPSCVGGGGGYSYGGGGGYYVPPVGVTGASFNPSTVQAGKQTTLTVNTSGPVTSVSATLPWNNQTVQLQGGGSTWTAVVAPALPSGVNGKTYTVPVSVTGSSGQTASGAAKVTVWQIVTSAPAADYGTPTTGSGQDVGTAPTNPGSGNLPPGSGTGTGTGTGTGPSQLIK